MFLINFILAYKTALGARGKAETFDELAELKLHQSPSIKMFSLPPSSNWEQQQIP